VVKLLGIDYPIIQAPFGGFPPQQLTAAVSNLGGLGSLGAVTLGSSAVTEVIEEIRSLTTKPFPINLWVSTSDRQATRIESDIIQSKILGLARYYAELGIEPPSQVESKPQDFGTQVRAAVDARPAVLSFIYGIPPAEILDECRKRATGSLAGAPSPVDAASRISIRIWPSRPGICYPRLRSTVATNRGTAPLDHGPARGEARSSRPQHSFATQRQSLVVYDTGASCTCRSIPTAMRFSPRS
jgi:hypothetical protein